MDIRENIKKFYKDVPMPGGYDWNHVETLRMIDLYYNSRYSSGKYDSSGFRKFFYNIVKPTCDIATKFVDIDTKNIFLVPTKGGHELKVHLLQLKLKQWLRSKGIATLLNEIAFDLPKYGHVVIKKTNNGWKKVNIQNLRVNPSSRSIQDSPFVYEVHLMTKAEIEEMGWSTENLKDLPVHRVFECYEKEGKKWKRIIKADVFTKEEDGKVIDTPESFINEDEEFDAPVILQDKKDAPFPYREVKWEEVPGRWLGFGFVEYLENEQVATNETENLERKALAHKALNIYQSRSDTVSGRNLLTGAENGDVLSVDSEITPVQKDNADLSAFNNTRGNWQAGIQRKTFTSDITTGSNLPSRTPLGVANLQAQLATSYFELKREVMGIFVKNWVIGDVIPDFKNDTKKEHILTLVGSDDELSVVDKAIIDAKLTDAKIDWAERTGFFPSRAQVEEARNRVREEISRTKNRYMKIPDRYYEDAKFFIDVITTGEQIDVGV